MVRTKDTTAATYEADPAGANRAQRLLGHLRHTRYLFYFAVVSTLLAAALVMLYGTVQIVVSSLISRSRRPTRWAP